MAIPDTTIIHQFGATNLSLNSNVVAATITTNQTLTATGNRILVFDNASGGALNITLPDAEESTGQTRTIVNRSALARNLNIVYNSVNIGLLVNPVANRGAIAVDTQNVMTFFSTGSAWICIEATWAPADAAA